MSLFQTHGIKVMLAVLCTTTSGYLLQASPLLADQALDRINQTPKVHSDIAYIPVSHASAELIKQRADNMNRFAFDLYQQLMKDGLQKNLVFSPLSVQGAFSLLYPATAEDQPASRELGASMHFAEPQSAYHDAMKGYLLHLKDIFAKRYENRRMEWQMVNDVWVDRKFGLQQEYLDTLKTYYNAGAGLIDVSSPATLEQSRLGINDYVANHTKSLIKDLLPPTALNAYSKVVLTNAVYMLADWEKPFAKESTRKEEFRRNAFSRVNVDMMRQIGFFGFMENAEYTAISLPYAGRELAILLILPKEVSSLESLAPSFSAEKLDLTLQQLAAHRVAVTMPKFSFAWGSASLKQPFKQLGFTALFNDTDDPLPRLLTEDSVPLTRGVYIDDIYHKANIIVDEKGTEAAAATGIIVGYRSAGRPEELKIFKMDRPAMFAIYDTKYHGVLFMGHVANPLMR